MKKHWVADRLGSPADAVAFFPVRVCQKLKKDSKQPGVAVTAISTGEPMSATRVRGPSTENSAGFCLLCFQP